MEYRPAPGGIKKSTTGFISSSHLLTLAIVGGDPVIDGINLLDEVLIDFVEHFLRELLGGCVQQQADDLSA